MGLARRAPGNSKKKWSDLQQLVATCCCTYCITNTDICMMSVCLHMCGGICICGKNPRSGTHIWQRVVRNCWDADADRVNAITPRCISHCSMNQAWLCMEKNMASSGQGSVSHQHANIMIQKNSKQRDLSIMLQS